MIKIINSLFGFSHYIFPCEFSVSGQQEMLDHIPIVEGILVIVMREILAPQFFRFCLELPK